MIALADPDGEQAHNAYHRFIRAGAWSMAWLWCKLTVLLVASLDLPERLYLHGDDTHFHKSGRKVNGAGSFPDTIRSRGHKIVYASRNGMMSPGTGRSSASAQSRASVCRRPLSGPTSSTRSTTC